MTSVVNVAGPCRSSTTDTAVQKALFNNRGLQTSYNDLALTESVLVQDRMQQNATFSIFGRVGNGTLEAERQVGGSIPIPMGSAISVRDRAATFPTSTTALRRRCRGSQRSGRHSLCRRQRTTGGLVTDAKPTAGSHGSSGTLGRFR
jgi:hypothetical protein